jgi:hypothetical protein
VRGCSWINHVNPVTYALTSTDEYRDELRHLISTGFKAEIEILCALHRAKDHLEGQTLLVTYIVGELYSLVNPA